MPTNVDPFESQLSDESERARLAKIFDTGLSTVVGYALPLRCVELEGERRWESGKWFLRRERMYLLPGDSPMGLRLPLDSIPWVKESDRPVFYEQDPMAERSDLPARDALSARQDLASLLERASQSARRDRARDSEQVPGQGIAHQELGPESGLRRPRLERHAANVPPAVGESAPRFGIPYTSSRRV